MFHSKFPALRFAPHLAGALFLSSSLQGELIISEFLAENSGLVLTDEDDFPADWIEIHNPDGTAASLDGYTLTDDPDVPAKWTFPAVTLQAGGYLRVFASGKDRTANLNQLHTNFSLSIGGEYLALIKPDGTTVADEFAPEYPPQIKDISFGLGNGGPLVETTIIPEAAPLTYFVPASDIGDSWQDTTFDDSSWTNATSAVGFGYSGSVGNLIGANGDVRPSMFNKNTSIYLRVPFQVGNPAGINSLQLKVKVDDGFAAYLNGEQVASFNAPTPLLFDSKATSSDEVDAGEDYAIYDLNIAGKLVAGENILAFHALNSAINNNDFFFISELAGEIQNLTPPFPRGYFEAPTPGSPNGPPALNPPSEVDFDTTSQAFADSLQVNLSVAEPGAVIRYTTNGSLPDKTSDQYSGSLSLTGSTLIRARAFLPGSLPGPSRSEGYMKIASSDADFSSDLPIILLSTFGKGSPPSTSATTRKDTFMLIYEPNPETGRSSFTGTPSIATRGGFRKRGSSSAGFPKYGMSFESWDENGDDKDISPLGLSPEADWIFNTRYTFDLSLMRNPFVYDLSNQIGRWAVKTRFVELFNDVSGTEVGGNDYFGVYTFMEKIEPDNNRLDLSKLDPWENSEEEKTGGYIFKNDRPDPGEPTFSVSGFQKGMVHVSPDGLAITSTQKSYITSNTNELTVALRAANGINPSTGLHFSDYLDVDSFIDNFWLNLLAMDPDWGRLSQFFYKDRGGKIMAGPVWDYDRTMGSRDGRDDNPERWEANTSDTSFTWFDREYEWFGLLFGFTTADDQVRNMSNPQLRSDRPEVFQKIIDRWYGLRGDKFSEANMHALVDTMADQIREAQARNFDRWGALNPGSVSGGSFAAAGTSGWEREVSHLKGWLKTRSEWIDEQFFAPPTFNNNGGEVAANFQLIIASPNGDVYYTTDGSDPRAAGGTPSASSVMASNATLGETTTVMARAYDGQQWGAPTTATFVIGGEVANSTNLVISEIMYDPAGPTAAEETAGFTDDKFFEYLEVLNTTGAIVNLSQVTFTDGLEFSFAGSSITELAPGARVLIVRSIAGFTERYGNGFANLIAGEFANDSGLSGGGERIIMTGMDGVIADVTYNNKSPWPKSPDGDGPSLVFISADVGIATNWRPSVELAGNPGTGDSTSFTGDATADADNDGYNAFAEYALGTDDAIANDEILVGSIDSKNRYALTYPRHLAADDAEIILQVSTDLLTWTLPGETLEDGKETHNGDGTVTYTFRTPDAATNTPHLFGRLLIMPR
jgi:hypothetical protein